MLTITRKTVSLLVVLALMISGFLTQMTDATESGGADWYSEVYMTDAEDMEEAKDAVNLEETEDALDSEEVEDALDSELVVQAADSSAVIQNYPMPSIYSASSVFTLKANNETIPVISYMPDYDYAQFSFSGMITIEVTNDVPITSYSISPQAKNIEGTVNGNKLTFTLTSSTYVIVKINEQKKKIVIAADPLETDIPASSGAGIYNVTHSPYNADKTGATMASPAIQQAIDAAHQAGGGIVYIPAGVYKSGNLTLKSNVTFYLAGGAVIVGTGRGEDYSNDFRKDSRNADGTYFIRTATDSSNITMRGRGTIDGKGVAMRERKMPAPHKNEGFLNNLLVPMQTSNFHFDGLILRDAGFWSFMVARSDNVTIKNLKGFQDLYKIENDVLDINESQNVLVQHAIGISDDDTFSTKTWLQTGMSKDWPGALEHLENVVFDDVLAWTRCVAFKIGMGVAQPQIGVTVRNSYVFQSARALLIDHGYQYNTLPEEGYAQNITFENIDIERVGINQFGNYWLGVSTSTSGDVSNVLLKNINVRETGSQKARITGNSVKGGMVNGITFSDVYIQGQLATSLDELNAYMNHNVSGIKIANSERLLSDNFEDGNAAGWTSVSGGWTVATTGANKLLTSGGQAVTSLLIRGAGNSWSDYAYEARVRMPITNANVGIVFRVKDANNYYMYRINSSNSKLELYKSIAGQLTLVSSTPFDAQQKQWYKMKAIVQGNMVKAYIDGRLVMEWSNPITELTTGGVGVRTTSASVHVDDVVVSTLPDIPGPMVIPFSDNFEDGNYTGWTAASGSWQVTTDGTKVLSQNSTATALITAGQAWIDYAYEARVKMPITNANAGIVFRVQDANNYYMYRINSSNQMVELYKSIDGQLTLAASSPFAASAQQWYTMMVVVQGNTIKGYVDGQFMMEWTNPVTELATGKIGFRTTSANVVFDHAIVRAPAH